jgi:integrase
MQDELDSGNGKVTYRRYIQAINGYVIPLLGRHNVDKIDYNVLAIYSNERKQLMNANIIAYNAKNPKTPKPLLEPSQSVINTHNVALNRVFDEALIRGFMTKSQVPHLENRGVSSDRRPTFTASEYIKIYKNFDKWTKTARKGNETLLRNVLANYILILANTGIRAGTEAMNLKWQHIAIEDVKATKTASNLLKKHIDKLNEQEQTLLMNFCFVMMDSRQRHTITKRMSYAVMNINKKVRRTEFKAVKQTKKARKQIQAKR